MRGSSEELIHVVFRQRVAESPNAIALVFGDQRLTYAELDSVSDTLAQQLEARGVSHGDVVALVMNRSVEMMVAMLGVLKLGAAYMPLDRDNPRARNQFCLEKAGVRLLISDRDGPDLSSAGRQRVAFTVEGLRTDPTAYPPREFSGETPAYVMFTSGTTSGPKGVVVPHRGVTRLVVDTNYINITPSDAILQFSTPSFDASTFEIWGALLNGATLVLYTGVVLDPNLFKRHMVEHRITILWLTAALFHLFAESCLDALRAVRILVAGGDVLHPEVVRRVLDRIDGITVINGYGPTENTTFTCCHVMTRENRPDGIVPIGQPINGTQAFILDEQRGQVGAGEVGELYAAGRGVALGYLGGDLGDGAFFRDARLAEGLIYRTGDLARRNEAGLLEFLGRRDSQVKVRGYRVSLEEIKARLMEIQAVQEAVVACQESPGGDQLLVAYLQTRDGWSLDAAAVRRQLSERVPSYMIPDRVVIGTGLPITQNGKVDRKKIFSSLV
jgi:amino acid adenylation domain-containing protein